MPECRWTLRADQSHTHLLLCHPVLLDCTPCSPVANRGQWKSSHFGELSVQKHLTHTAWVDKPTARDNNSMPFRWLRRAASARGVAHMVGAHASSSSAIRAANDARIQYTPKSTDHVNGRNPTLVHERCPASQSLRTQ